MKKINLIGIAGLLLGSLGFLSLPKTLKVEVAGHNLEYFSPEEVPDRSQIRNILIYRFPIDSSMDANLKYRMPVTIKNRNLLFDSGSGQMVMTLVHDNLRGEELEATTANQVAGDVSTQLTQKSVRWCGTMEHTADGEFEWECGHAPVDEITKTIGSIPPRSAEGLGFSINIHGPAVVNDLRTAFFSLDVSVENRKDRSISFAVFALSEDRYDAIQENNGELMKFVKSITREGQSGQVENVCFIDDGPDMYSNAEGSVSIVYYGGQIDDFIVSPEEPTSQCQKV